MKNSKLILLLVSVYCIILCGCAAKSLQNSNQIKTNSTSGTTAKNSNKAKIICPKCGKSGVKIVYGKPGGKTLKKAKEKKVYLGGCVKTPKSPKYHCYHCGNNWK
jgi:hypothetical protein